MWQIVVLYIEVKADKLRTVTFVYFPIAFIYSPSPLLCHQGVGKDTIYGPKLLAIGFFLLCCRLTSVPCLKQQGTPCSVLRVATKISRYEIPWYFVIFLFRIFAKILGKFSRNFLYLVQIILKKTCPSMGKWKSLVSLEPGVIST
jgi:hypothetical protein